MSEGIIVYGLHAVEAVLEQTPARVLGGLVQRDRGDARLEAVRSSSARATGRRSMPRAAQAARTASSGASPRSRCTRPPSTRSGVRSSTASTACNP